MSEERPGQTPSGEPMHLPPATFEFLVASLRTQVEIALLRGPKNEEDPDFMVARHMIDLLAVLQTKTHGNLSMEEQRFLENSLTELRVRFVQAWEESRKKAAAAPAEAPQA